MFEVGAAVEVELQGGLEEGLPVAVAVELEVEVEVGVRRGEVRCGEEEMRRI